jgi:hypothetical protein
MATSVRSGTARAATLRETSWLVKDGSFDANKNLCVAWDVNTSLKHQSIENQAAKVVDLGKHANGFGLAHPESQVSWSSYLYGQGTAKDGTTGNIIPTIPITMQQVAACLGFVPKLLDADLVDDGSTTTSVILKETNTNFLANDGTGFICVQDNTNGLIAHLRPVLNYNSGTKTATLGMALPAAPTEDRICYGLCYGEMSEEANTYIIQGEVLKRNSTDPTKAGQMYEFFGAVGNFSLAEVGVAEAQTIAFTYNVGAFTRYNPKTRSAPLSQRPKVSAGGAFLLAKTGNTAVTELKFLNVGVEVGREYTPDPRSNEVEGIGGWVLQSQDTMITLHVHDDQALPAGFSAANFPDAFKTGENNFHLLLAFGNKKPGDIFGFYFKNIQMEGEPEDADINGLQCWKITFSLCAGGGEDKIWVAAA